MNHFRALIVFAIVIAILGIAFVGSALMVSAKCDGIQTITPINLYANIRRGPTTLSSIADTLKRGQSEEYDTYVNHWYHLSGGGYVHDSVVEMKCVPLPTPTRPVVLVTNTVDVNGNREYHYICPSACEITVKLEELP